eukprot:Pgem_evm1s14848
MDSIELTKLPTYVSRVKDTNTYFTESRNKITTSTNPLTYTYEGKGDRFVEVYDVTGTVLVNSIYKAGKDNVDTNYFSLKLYENDENNYDCYEIVLQDIPGTRTKTKEIEICFDGIYWEQ